MRNVRAVRALGQRACVGDKGEKFVIQTVIRVGLGCLLDYPIANVLSPEETGFYFSGVFIIFVAAPVLIFVLMRVDTYVKKRIEDDKSSRR